MKSGSNSFITYTAYMASPAHVELIAEEKSEEVAKEAAPAAPKLSKKQLAQARTKRVIVGGGN